MKKPTKNTKMSDIQVLEKLEEILMDFKKNDDPFYKKSMYPIFSDYSSVDINSDFVVKIWKELEKRTKRVFSSSDFVSMLFLRSVPSYILFPKKQGVSLKDTERFMGISR